MIYVGGDTAAQNRYQEGKVLSVSTRTEVVLVDLPDRPLPPIPART